MLRPRDHHYYFVHHALPSLFYSDPARFIIALSQERERFLHSIWRQAGESLPPATRNAPDGLRGMLRYSAGSTAVALIVLPQPQAATEAYFAAALYRPAQIRSAQPSSLTRFITLEYATELDGAPYTVLCERTAAQSHRNMGRGPEPTLAAFVRSVTELYLR